MPDLDPKLFAEHGVQTLVVLPGEKVMLFIGSQSADSVQHIQEELVKRVPDVQFIVMAGFIDVAKISKR